MNKVIFATGNNHKVEELFNIFRNLNPERPLPPITSLAELQFEQEIPEDHDTLEENARQKAKFIYDHFQLPCFAEDTGLEVNQLNGAPGVHSARFAGDQRSDSDNIQLLLKRLIGETDRSARFRTIIAFTKDGKNFATFEGIINGLITPFPKGEGGFGYDPVFQPEGLNQTFGQLASEVKNKISHRYQATVKFCQFLETVRF